MSTEEIPYDPTLIPKDGQWRLFSHDPQVGITKWYMMLDNGDVVFKTEYTKMDAVIARNKIAYNESIGKRWGDGQRAASIPMPMFFKHLAEAQKADDKKYISKWLNDPDHRAFRTFHGKV